MMIKKTYLAILSIAIASVLLGSLFYINITQAQGGKARTYKDHMEIVVLEWTSREFGVNSDQRDYGVALITDSPITLPFFFSPKEAFMNITNLWITFTAQNMYPAHLTIPVNITINDVATISTDEFYPSMNIGLKVVSLHITNLNVYETITSGLNNLVLTSSENLLTVFRVSVFIEYEYQAR